MDEKNVNQDVEKNLNDEKKKKIMLFSIIGGVTILLLILIIVIFSMMSKPSKNKAENLVKNYLKAVNEHDGEKLSKILDIKGYIIFNEEDEKKFDKNYKNKEKYIKDYVDEKNYDDLADAKESILKKFESRYSYSSKEYTLKEVTEVKKSNRSKKIYVIKGKVKVKSTYYSTTDTKNIKLYVIKADGEYKVVGAELDN